MAEIKEINSEEKKEKSAHLKKLDDMLFSKHWQITIRVVAITLATIAVFGGIGYLVDKFLESSPAFTIIGAVVSYPFAQLVIYKTFKKITK